MGGAPAEASGRGGRPKRRRAAAAAPAQRGNKERTKSESEHLQDDNSDEN